MTEKRISTAPIRKLAEERGIDNLYDLAKKAGITHNTMRRFWLDDPTLSRFEAHILIKIADALECDPLELLETIY